MVGNGIIYALIIGYIIYINVAAYLKTTTRFLNFLINLFQNWIFRLVFLLIIGFFALDLFPQGGFILAVLLTIAFLNTSLLMYKTKIQESFLDWESIENFQNNGLTCGLSCSL